MQDLMQARVVSTIWRASFCHLRLAPQPRAMWSVLLALMRMRVQPYLGVLRALRKLTVTLPRALQSFTVVAAPEETQLRQDCRRAVP